MQKFVTLTILTFTFFLTSSVSKRNESEADFQKKVESFIQKYAAELTVVKETLRTGNNDFIVDKQANSWNKTVTLKSRNSTKNEAKQTIYQRFFLGFYHYEDEKQCSAALDSLLNCFGNDCQKIQWGDNGKSIKTIPTVYIVNEKEIIVCKIRCEQKTDFWTTFKNDLITTFGSESSGIIDVGCGGPVNFRKF